MVIVIIDDDEYDYCEGCGAYYEEDCCCFTVGDVVTGVIVGEVVEDILDDFL